MTKDSQKKDREREQGAVKKPVSTEQSMGKVTEHGKGNREHGTGRGNRAQQRGQGTGDREQEGEHEKRTEGWEREQRTGNRTGKENSSKKYII